MSDKKDKKEDQKSMLGRAYDSATKGVSQAVDATQKAAKELGDDVVNDTHELKDEFIKYGKNRIAMGTALAVKGGLIGTLIPIPIVGTKTGIVVGFAAGFFGGKPLANKLEKWLERREETAREAVSNDNTDTAAPTVEQSQDQDRPAEDPPATPPPDLKL